MKNELDINQAQSFNLSRAEFVDFLLSDGGHNYEQDFEGDGRLHYLKSKVECRNGSCTPQVGERFPNQFVVQVAAAKFFRLVEISLRRLNKMFNVREMGIILNSTCGPVWNWDPRRSIAGMVADENGIDNPLLLATSSTMRVLLEKLMTLSLSENAALIDLCETVWRTKHCVRLEDLCAELGMPLAD